MVESVWNMASDYQMQPAPVSMFQDLLGFSSPRVFPSKLAILENDSWWFKPLRIWFFWNDQWLNHQESFSRIASFGTNHMDKLW